MEWKAFCEAHGVILPNEMTAAQRELWEERWRQEHPPTPPANDDNASLED